jgi:hypothetical protein
MAKAKTVPAVDAGLAVAVAEDLALRRNQLEDAFDLEILRLAEAGDEGSETLFSLGRGLGLHDEEIMRHLGRGRSVWRWKLKAGTAADRKRSEEELDAFAPEHKKARAERAEARERLDALDRADDERLAGLKTRLFQQAQAVGSLRGAVPPWTKDRYHRARQRAGRDFAWLDLAETRLRTIESTHALALDAENPRLEVRQERAERIRRHVETTVADLALPEATRAAAALVVTRRVRAQGSRQGPLAVRVQGTKATFGGPDGDVGAQGAQVEVVRTPHPEVTTHVEEKVDETALRAYLAVLDQEAAELLPRVEAGRQARQAAVEDAERILDCYLTE